MTSKVIHERFPVLVSYAYLRKCPDHYIKWLFQDGSLRLLLDSGAFTAFSTGKPIDVRDYIRFLQKWSRSIKRYMALDVIADPPATRRNLETMLSAGLEPIPVFVTGEQEPWMNELYKHKDIIAVPLSLPVSKNLSVRKKFLQVRMQWAAGRKVHWFGYTIPSSIAKWKPYSCDSSSWISSVQYGFMYVYHGNGRMERATLKECLTGRKGPMVRERLRELGYDEELCTNKDHWRRNLKIGIPASQDILYQVTTDSMVKLSRHVRERFGTWQYLAVEPSYGPGNMDFYWLYRHIRGDDIAAITEQPTWDLYDVKEEKDVRTKRGRVVVGRARLDSAAVLPRRSKVILGGPVRRLRADPQEGTRFRSRSLFEDESSLEDS